MRVNNVSRGLTFFWTKSLKPLLKLDKNLIGSGECTLKVDVVIPCLDKDLSTLPMVTKSLRQYLAHPINQIYIVAPLDSKELKQFCVDNECSFVNEETVAPISIKGFVYDPMGQDRSGWIYQQLIKLNADRLSKMENYIVWDADTILIRPQAYFRKGKYILDHSDEFHEPYFECYEKILKNRPRSKVSFVSHHMILSKKILKELKSDIEAGTKKRWYEIIIDSLDQDQTSSFSEYELYGNYINSRYPRSFTLEYWFNKTYQRATLDNWKALAIEAKIEKVKSLSWHSYN